MVYDISQIHKIKLGGINVQTQPTQEQVSAAISVLNLAAAGINIVPDALLQAAQNVLTTHLQLA